MDSLLSALTAAYPKLRFAASDSFCWSPGSGRIYYDKQAARESSATWSLLHEVGHALRGHTRFTHDFELLGYEVDAWDEAKRLAGLFGQRIDQEHIENCLDTYREWLHSRSICPACGSQALQLDGEPRYRCFNCANVWRVSASRACRPYRLCQK